eukprot:00900_3
MTLRGFRARPIVLLLGWSLLKFQLFLQNPSLMRNYSGSVFLPQFCVHVCILGGDFARLGFEFIYEAAATVEGLRPSRGLSGS